MRKRVIGLGGTLFLFALFFTAILIAAFAVYVKLLPSPNIEIPGYLIDMDDKAIYFSYEQGANTIPIDAINGFITKDEMDKLYLTAIMKDLPYLLAFILFFFTVSSLFLSKILKSRQEKQAIIIARQLSQIEDGKESFEIHPEIMKAYQTVKARLEAGFMDYARLCAFVTHEQKNMLSLLRARLQVEGNSALVQDVDRVADSLDDILTLSASGRDADMEIVDTALVCAGVCDEYRKIYPNIRFDFDEAANSLIASKELWLSRAVSNLINNAIKYAGGRIEVSVSNQNGSVIIQVADGGEGIPEEDMDKLFDYSYRIAQLKKDGYGIGLSLVRHVCDICGGLYYAENKNPNGAVFYMVFPEALTLN